MYRCFHLIQPYAKIIAKQLKIPTKKYYPKKIAQFFQIPIPQQTPQSQIPKLYLSYFTTPNIQQKLRCINIDNFLLAQQKYQIIQYTKQQISKYTNFTPELQNIIDIFFGFVGKIYVNKYSNNTQRYRQTQIVYDKQLSQCLVSFNQFFILLTPNINNCVLYTKMISTMVNFRKLHINLQQYQLNYRICIDYLLQISIKQYNPEIIYGIFRNFAFGGLNHLYFQRSAQVIQYFWGGIKYQWYLQVRMRRQILIAIIKLNFYTKNMLEQMETLFFYNLDSKSNNYNNKNIKLDSRYKMPIEQLIIILKILINFKKLTSQTLPKFQPSILKLMQLAQYMKVDFFDQTLKYFYTAGLWIKQYWLNFAKNLQQNQTNKQLYRLYVVQQLLPIYSQQIPSQIITKLSPILFKKLKNFNQQNLFLDFIQKQTNQKNLACQTTMANTLRLLNLGIINTQFLIKIFYVDILIDNNIVIQINGNTHYIFNIDTMQKQFNVHTEFRSKVLSKIGYDVVDVDLESQTESFQIFHLMKEVYYSRKGGKSMDKIIDENKFRKGFKILLRYTKN